MATTSIAGWGGNCTGPTGVTEVMDWKASISVDKLDATSMASGGWKEYIAGLIGCEGSFNCQGTVIPARGLVASLVLTSSGTVGPSFSGSAIIDKVDVDVPVNGKVVYACSFAFTSTITVGHDGV